MRHISDVYDKTASDHAVSLILEDLIIYYSEVFFKETSINNLYIDDHVKIKHEVTIHLQFSLQIGGKSFIKFTAKIRDDEIFNSTVEETVLDDMIHDLIVYVNVNVKSEILNNSKIHELIFDDTVNDSNVQVNESVLSDVLNNSTV